MDKMDTLKERIRAKQLSADLINKLSAIDLFKLERLIGRRELTNQYIQQITSKYIQQ